MAEIPDCLYWGFVGIPEEKLTRWQLSARNLRMVFVSAEYLSG